MIKQLTACVAFVAFACVGNSVQVAPERIAQGDHHMFVELETTAGTIKLELFEEDAPITVKNFLRYVEEGHYDGTVFHRVIDNFMIQGGGFDEEFQQKSTHEPITNEANNGLTNDRGTIAMARTNDVHSATAQFFINVADNGFLNHRSNSPSAYGYCVFGKVVDGMAVVDQIKEVETHSKLFHQDVPVENITIKKASVAKAKG